MKKRIRSAFYNPDAIRAKVRRKYIRKYFRAFMSNFEVSGIDSEAQYFLFTSFWERGTVAAFLAKGGRIFEQGEERNDLLFFADYNAQRFDNYGFAKIVNIINPWNAPFYPDSPLIVHESAVIGFANDEHIPVFTEIADDIEAIVRVRMVIETHLQLAKLPFVFTGDEKDSRNFENVLRDITNDELAVFMTSREINMLKSLPTAGNYIIDKLEAYLEILDSDVLTYLGVDNSNLEKKERLIVDEVNANNNAINANLNNYIKFFRSFFDECNEVLGTDIRIEPAIEPSMSVHEEKTKEVKDDGAANN